MGSTREQINAYVAADGMARAALHDVAAGIANPHGRAVLTAYIDSPRPMLQLRDLYPGVAYSTLATRWHRRRMPSVVRIRRWVLCARLARMLESDLGTFAAACVEVGMVPQHIRRILLPVLERGHGPAAYLRRAGSAPMVAAFRDLVDTHRAALEAWTPVERRALRALPAVTALRRRERELETALAQVRRDLSAAIRAAA